MSTLGGVDLTSPTDGLGVLAFRGADAARFLQGQLSADVEKLAIGDSTLAGLHNPQGRVIALLALLRATAEEVLAILPRELVEPAEQRLRKYILRAKVRIENLGSSLRVVGSVSAPPASPSIPQLRWGDRRLLLAPATTELAETISRAEWDLADIASGLPQVFAATSELFVAQMLNLDLLGAIAFDKGCYTGQEVIARAHYRGKVKRRLQRWRTLAADAPTLAAGATVHAGDGRKLVVVKSARLNSGLQELLAVGGFGVAPDAEEPAAAPPGITVAGPLPLPYSLPE